MAIKTVSTLKRLGDMLVETGIIEEDQLQEALSIQKQAGGKLGEILVRLGYISEEVLIAFLGRQLGIQFVSIEEYGEISSEAIMAVPENVARKQTIMPIEKRNNTLVVAVADPFNVVAIDDLKIITGFDIEVVIATEKDIKAAIEKYYGQKTDQIQKIIKEEEIEIVKEEKEKELVSLEEQADAAPIIKIVNYILTEAVRGRASDIHIEPYEKNLRLRYRIDGVLHERPSPPKDLQNAIISRIKVMASLDLAEHRKPQDGRIKIKVLGKEVDLRVSVLPTAFGEKAVMRILDSTALCLDLNKLGFEPETLEVYQRNISRPHGIILVTGPTGSGKSTTLYSTLSTLNHPDVNILTIEDPVEYIMEGVNQVHVNPDVGLTFAQGLRSFLRQDPDIIMVGEIRDTETAEIAINAALTGHLVFSTLHTNDAPTAITRLINMGIEPFLIASTVTMVVAQRLVRVICKHCRQGYEVSVENLLPYGIKIDETNEPTVTLYRGQGCFHCSNTGYRGRLGCFEGMEIDDEVRELILERASSNVIKNVARKKGMLTLRESAIKKLLSGVTTIEELLRVTASDVEVEVENA